MRRAAMMVICLVFSADPAIAGMERAAEYNEKGVAALGEGDFYAAIDYLRRALSEAPDNRTISSNLSNAYNNYGLNLMRQGKVLGAIDNFKKAVRHDPDNAYAHLDLGQAYYKNNDLERAVNSLEEAYRIKPEISGLKDFLDKAKGEAGSESGLNRTDSMHFTIVWADGLKVDNLADLRTSLEGAYTGVGSFFNCFPREKTTVVVYSDDAYSSRISGRPYWAHAMFDGKIKIPLGKSRFPKDYIMRIIHHEYTHAVMRQMAGTSCPLWLNEGLATYMEKNPFFNNRNFFRSYISSENVTLLSGMPSSYSEISDPQRAYREFYLMANFLVSRLGSAGIRRMISSFRNGLSSEEVIKDVMSMDTEAFDRAWKAYVRRRVGL